MAPFTWQLALALFVLFTKGFRIKRNQIDRVLATSSRRQTGSWIIYEAAPAPIAVASPTASYTLPSLRKYGDPRPLAETASSGPLGILPATLPTRYGDLFDETSSQREGDNQSRDIYRERSLAGLLTTGILSELAEAEDSEDYLEEGEDEDSSAQAAEKNATAAAVVMGNGEASVAEARYKVEDAKRKVKKLQHIKAEVKIVQDNLEGLGNLSMYALKDLETEFASHAASKRPEDAESSWSINFPTFLSLKDHSTEEELIESFNFFDVDGNGAITAAEVSDMMTDLREKWSDKAATMQVALAEAAAVEKARAHSERIALHQFDMHPKRTSAHPNEAAAVEKARAHSEKMAYSEKIAEHQAMVGQAAPAAETTEMMAVAEANPERLQMQIERLEKLAALDQLETSPSPVRHELVPIVRSPAWHRSHPVQSESSPAQSQSSPVSVQSSPVQEEVADAKKVMGHTRGAGCRGEACKRHVQAPVVIGPPADWATKKEEEVADAKKVMGHTRGAGCRGEACKRHVQAPKVIGQPADRATKKEESVLEALSFFVFLGICVGFIIGFVFR